MTEIHSNAELYAVGGLDASEVAEFEQHLDQCDDCREEVATMREITSSMSQAVAADPPAALRASVLAEIASTPQVAALSAPGRHARAGTDAPSAASELTAPAAAAASPEPASNVLPLRRSWGSRASAIVAAAAVLGAIGVGGWAIQDRNDARDQNEAASAKVEQLTTLLSATDVQAVSAQTSSGGNATVVRSTSKQQALLVTADLPALDSGRVYEAWTFEGETAVPAGTFRADAAGATHELPTAAVDSAVIALTVEPEGGSDQPTTEPVVVINL